MGHLDVAILAHFSLLSPSGLGEGVWCGVFVCVVLRYNSQAVRIIGVAWRGGEKVEGD